MIFRQFSFLLFALLGALRLDAASWTDVRYGVQNESAPLDIHAPPGAGPHPVLVWLHSVDGAIGDAHLSEEQISRINAAGHVLVSVEYSVALTRHPAQIENAAAAVAYTYRNIARFGGDPSRIRLFGAGTGAHLAALLAVDARWLKAQGMTPDVIEGVVLLRATTLDLEASMRQASDRNQYLRLAGQWGDQPEGWLQASPLAQIRPENRVPPFLLLAARDGVREHARQRERFADRLREAGVANQVVLLSATVAGADGKGLEALDSSARDAMFSWLNALALPRLTRFEHLDFSADFVSGMADGRIRLRGAEVAFLFPYRGTLIASLNDADPQSIEPARVLVKRSHDGYWTQAHAFAGDGAKFTALAGISLQRSGSAQLLARPVELLVAGISNAAGGFDWHWSASDQPFRALASMPHALSAMHVHRDRVTGADVLLLGSRGGGVHSAEWKVTQAKLDVRTSAELEGADIAGFALANGVAFAAVNGKNSGLYQRVDGTAPSWQHVADLDSAGFHGSAVTAISAVADPLAGGHDVLLLAYAHSGRIVRVDPGTGFGKTLELDIAAGFAEVWGGELPEVDFGGNAFVALRHPETADQVLAIGLKLHHPQSQQTPHNGAWYLLRQHDGSYSYGLSYDYADPPVEGTSLRSVRALATSPFVEDQGAGFYFGGFDAYPADRDSAWIYRGAMQAVAVQRGLWWDRNHRGHGVDLQPVAGGWMLTLVTYDSKGEPVWYAALGQIVGARFVADENGLTRYRYALDRDPPQRRDALLSGDVSIRFGVSADQGACANTDADRADALALAELSLRIEGRDVRWCIEPMRFAEAGIATTDANGLWYAGPGDAGWGVSIAERGVDGRSLGVAYVYYYDANGAPRWALGTAPVVQGNARYALRSFRGYCPGCSRAEISSEPVGEFVHRLGGLCGDVGGTGSLDIGNPDITGRNQDDHRFVRPRFPMNRISNAACY